MNILTHQQFSILKYLYLNGTRSGREIRDYLESIGVHSGKPAWYLLVGRMHANNLIGKKEKRIFVLDQHVLEYEYYITEKGLKMLKNTLEFYQL